jgi:hypothetical protein
MGIRFCKWFYRQWKLVEGDARWDAVGSLWQWLLPGGVGVVMIGVAKWAWPGELTGPWLLLYFFSWYVACWVLIAALVTIAVKGKQLFAEDELRERMRRKQQAELDHLATRGEIILNQCKVKDPTKKIEESFPRWEAEVMTYLQNFSDADYVENFSVAMTSLSPPAWL